MKTLLIMRHAKSSWDRPDLSDFDRTLNDRGRRTAPLMGDLMRREGLVPDTIICSPAVRAKATAEALGIARTDARIILNQDIYEASANTLRGVISTSPAESAVVMIVGHNPGVEGLIHSLTGESERMPTCALAVIDLEIDDWSGVAAGRGTLRRLYRPKTDLG